MGVKSGLVPETEAEFSTSVDAGLDDSQSKPAEYDHMEVAMCQCIVSVLASGIFGDIRRCTLHFSKEIEIHYYCCRTVVHCQMMGQEKKK